MSELHIWLQQLMEAHDIPLWGVAPAIPDPNAEAHYTTWLEQERHGGLGYLQRHAPAKLHPERLLPGCQSILVIGIHYYRSRPLVAEGMALVARHAWGSDYHAVLLGKLGQLQQALESRFPAERFSVAADNTPLLEKHYAVAAGLGVQGKHTLVINPRFGSWILIGEMLSTLELPVTTKIAAPVSPCGSCSLCIEACPTGALQEPGVLEAGRCLSCLSVEVRTSVPEEKRRALGPRIYGCDVCQEVCPQNRGVPHTRQPEFLRDMAGPALDPGEVLALDEKDFRARFTGTSLFRSGRRGLVRNACVVAANLGRRDLLPRLRELNFDADEVVAEHAAWAINELG